MARQANWLRECMWLGIYAMWPVTFAILAYDDLTHHATMHQRLMHVFTIDVMAALLWPITWIYWTYQSLLQHSTALSRLVGL